jgi:HTH-type transcriptional regulator/antitoxin HipB
MSTNILTSGQLGPVLKQLRIQQGYSQVGLGEKIGLSQERISKIENHPERCRLDQILTVLMALDAVMSVTPRTASSGQAQALASSAATDADNAPPRKPDEPAPPEDEELW